MRRSSIAIQWFALSSLIALLAATAWVVLSTTTANAQATEDAVVTLAVSSSDVDAETRTVSIGVDPGDSNLAAIGAGFRYDQDHVTVVSCGVSDAGACNDVGGLVRFSVFNLAGLSVNEQLLTVDFVPAVGAKGSTIFELDIDTAINSHGDNVPLQAVTPIEVSLTAPERGALTGDVVDEAATGLYGLDVCVINDVTEQRTCTITTGLGTWRIDNLAVGEYDVEVTDPNLVYAAATATATVVADDVVAGVDASLTYLADQSPVDSQHDGTPAPDPAAAVRYEASITGTVLAPVTQQPVEDVQVCATQVAGPQQSCATTNANGEYQLTGVSSGHYWVSTVDGHGQLGAAKPRLVGVIRDDVTRSGVRLVLTPAP